LGGWWTGMTEKDGKITGLDIFVYSPHPGESVLVDNIRLDAVARPRRPRAVTFKVLGTDMTVPGIARLGAMLKDAWTEPKANTPDDVEAAFRARYDELKKTHPKAVLAILRDGEKGFDPADPEKVYAGWIDAHMNSHGPDSNIVGIAANIQGWGSLEAFMRHRGLMARADFSSIPVGSKVLAAQLVLVRTAELPKKANMYVVEPCNRPWVEREINGYEYAKDKYWRSVGGFAKPESYEGDDPDFWPVYATHGPFNGTAGTWDLTEAMKFWLEEGKPNHGFFFHGDSADYTAVFSREFQDVKKRPTIMVVYEPKP
ncbi:MAG TPA: DNRLRE domain-containing protein, partial [Planctomycetota bacterium]|nr:DNRLRE domain-containing protein [Planctomycetota bacterium]